MSTVFNEESAQLISELRQVAKAISLATTSTSAGFKDNDAVFALSRSLPDVTVAIRGAGQKLLQLVDKFENSVENQLVNFFRTMKLQVDQEYQLLRTTKSLLPTDPGLLKHLVTATQEQLAASTNAILSSSSHQQASGSSTITKLPLLTAASGRSPKQPSPLCPPLIRDAVHTVPSATVAGSSALVTTTTTKDLQAMSAEALHTWLYLTLQSTMQLCEASRGAVFLKSLEGTAYLRRVCGINVDGRLPTDVSPAAGSTISTVVQNSVAVNIGRSRCSNPNALDAYSAASQAVRASVAIQINTGVILPIGDIGCILVADKMTESFFSELDEHVLWSASIIIRGALKRYPTDLLFNKTPITAMHALNVSALLPPIAPFEGNAESAVTPRSNAGGEEGAADRSPRGTLRKSTKVAGGGSSSPNSKRFLSPEEELQSLLPGIGRIPRLPKKLVVVRTSESGGFQQLMAKDLEAMKKIELSDEDLLEAAVPYIANLESLWKKSIDSLTELRSTCERLTNDVATKNSRIVELEVDIRVLSRQLQSMKVDVQKIRAAVPSHLREIAAASSNPADVVSVSSPAFAHSIAGGDTKGLRGAMPRANPRGDTTSHSPTAPMIPNPPQHKQTPSTAR